MKREFILKVYEDNTALFEKAVEEHQICPSAKIYKEGEILCLFTTFKPVEDARIQFIIERTLLLLYPMAELAEEDVSIKPTFSDNSYVTAYKIIRAYVGKVLTHDKSGHAARVIKSYCESVGLNMINNRPSINFLSINNHGEILSHSIKNDSFLIEHAQKSPHVLYNFSILEEDFKKHQDEHESNNTRGKLKLNKFTPLNLKVKIQRGERGINMDELLCNCQLLGDYLAGDRAIMEHELYVLQTGLAKADSGKLLHEKILENAQLSATQKNSMRYQFEIIKISKLDTVKCVDNNCDFVCPFAEKCDHKVNMLQQTNAKRGEVRYLGENIHRKGVDEAFLDFSKELQKVYKTNDQKVHVLKAPTGLGKTEAMLSLNLENVAIALPTHELCQEVHKRLKQAGHDFLLVSERPNMPPELEHEHTVLQRMGFYKKASRIVFKYADKIKSKSPFLLSQDERNLLDYVNSVKSMKIATKIIVTHQRLLQLKNKNIKTYIIDEDILLTNMIKTITLSEHNIESILMSGDNININGEEDQSVVGTIMQFLYVPEGKFYTKDTLCSREKLEEYLLNKREYINHNVIDFLDCDYYLSTRNNSGEKFIHTTKLLPLDQDKEKKIIIMSATANQLIYEKVFKKRLEFIDIGQTDMKGRIIWYPEKSFSRAQFKKHFSELDIKHFGETNVISYKKYKDFLLEKELNVVATFGSTTGLDKFKGQDLMVIGSPYTYREVYLLIGMMLGIKVTEEDCIVENYELSPVTRYGYQFSCVTFKQNKELQEVQLALIESELVQAVGRARTLRYDCKVEVFSRIPVPSALLA
ncbi:hypothetical protein RCG17_06715 [Neobacillus sp. PS3-12]|uniref:hypothetical protein n=1 Tax=Neobacillus sp. PS3-12 TaxID=3070677 RepID=UPI0027E1E141|nr:hypothetical protein [Neobacillus sp. PS3-12]WML54333.1 hypothetical protein RCG17_06715 [Neobacillus sp. PS3-12]